MHNRRTYYVSEKEMNITQYDIGYRTGVLRRSCANRFRRGGSIRVWASREISNLLVEGRKDRKGKEDGDRRKRETGRVNDGKGRLRVGAGGGSTERGSTTLVLKMERANYECERDEERERKTERDKEIVRGRWSFRVSRHSRPHPEVPVQFT